MDKQAQHHADSGGLGKVGIFIGGMLVLLLLALVMLAGAAVMLLANSTGKEAPPSAGAACSWPSQHQAESLLGRHFPNGLIVGTSQTKLGTACILEVEMRVDSSDPSTQGFVYLMPDGDHFLNGPLMNSTSQLGFVRSPAADTLTTHDSALAADMEKLAQLAALKAMLETPATPGSSSDSTFRPMDSSAPMTVEDALREISILPNQFVSYPDRPNTIYIVFDPRCATCRRQYAVQQDIANAANAKVIWIPTYSDSESQFIGAHLVGALSEGDARGLKLLDLILGEANVDAHTLDQELGTPRDEDFELLDQSAEYLRLMMREQQLGTPLILYRDSAGATTLFNGYASPDEFSVQP